MAFIFPFIEEMWLNGSTGIACKKLNRNFIGIEKDPKYFEVAKKRIEEANG